MSSPIFQEDFRKGPSRIEFPTLASWYTGRSLPAPTGIFDFEQSSGVETDHISGTRTLTPYNSPLQGRTAWGLGDGAGNWDQKKCVEFQWNTPAYMLMSDNTFDIPVAGSMAYLIVYRCQWTDVGTTYSYPYANGGLMSKYIYSGGDIGYGIQTGGTSIHGGPGQFAGGTGLSQLTNVDDDAWNQWTCMVVSFRYSNRYRYINVPGRAPTSTWYQYWGLNAPTPLRIGAGKDWQGNNVNSGLFQIAYLAFWEDCADTIGDGSTLLDTFWVAQNQDPGGYYPDVTFPEQSRSDYGGYAGVIAEPDSGHARLRECGFEMTPYHVQSGFSHDNKLGVYLGFAPTNPTGEIFTVTDEFNDPAWVKTNVDVGLDNSDLDECPTGMLMAMKLTATADNAQLHSVGNFQAGSLNYLSLFYKRHSSMTGNVTGRIRVKNLTTSLYEYDEVVTFKEHWTWWRQKIACANTNCQIEIVIDDDTKSICLYRVTGGIGITTYSRRAESDRNQGPWMLATMPSVEDWMKAAQGELEIVFSMDTTHIAQRYLFDSGDDAGTDHPDGKTVRGDNHDLLVSMYNGSGALDHSISSGIDITDKEVEHTFILRWDNDNPTFNGYYSEVEFDGVVIPGATTGWTINGTVLKRLFLGDWVGDDYWLRTCAVVSRVRIWEFPNDRDPAGILTDAGDPVRADLNRVAPGEEIVALDIWPAEPAPAPTREEIIEVESLELLAQDTLLLTFSHAMANDDALQDPASYSIVRDSDSSVIPVRQVLTGSQEETDLVVLVMQKPTIAEVHTVTVSDAVRGADGNLMKPGSEFGQFEVRRTKMDRALNSTPALYSHRHHTRLRLTLHAILREDEWIGGNRDDFLE